MNVLSRVPITLVSFIPSAEHYNNILKYFMLVIKLCLLNGNALVVLIFTKSAYPGTVSST